MRQCARVTRPPTEVALAFLSGYLAFLPAAALGVSGVLAVTIGVYMGRYTQLTNATRGSGNAFWEIPVSWSTLLFAMVGLQLRGIPHRLKCCSRTPPIAAAVIILRIVGPIFTTRRASFSAACARDPYPRGAPVVIAWAGIRGAVSLPRPVPAQA